MDTRFNALTRALVVATGIMLLASAPASAKSKAAAQAVDVRFAAVAGKAPVQCGSLITGLGSTDQSAELADFRFYVSQVALIRSDGRAVSVKLRRNSQFRYSNRYGAVTLIDLENGTGDCAEEGTSAMNADVQGTVPSGRYVGVQWTVGVPAKLNHTDIAGAPAPLNLAGMGWSWQYGRKFMKIEVTEPPGTTTPWPSKTFFVHVGSNGCVGDPATGASVKCALANEAKVRLGHFNPKHQVVDVDLKALLAGDDITVNRSGAPGCMSEETDPECEGVFKALGISWRADGSGTGKSSSSLQTVFTVASR